MTPECSIGVGDGRGQLFVHGSYEAIRRVQEMIFELERGLELIALLNEASAYAPLDLLKRFDAAIGRAVR